MQHEGLEDVLKVGALQIFFDMLAKLVCVPLLMLALALFLGLNDEQGRMAVVLSALPVTMASYSLTSHYEVNKARLGANVIVGMLLLMPTVLGWLVAMDTMAGVFPIAAAPC
jgi:predicted permease